MPDLQKTAVTVDASMILTTIAATDCGATTCPTVYVNDRGNVIVQGYTVSSVEAGLDVPDGERLVEIPVELLREAARHFA